MHTANPKAGDPAKAAVYRGSCDKPSEQATMPALVSAHLAAVPPGTPPAELRNTAIPAKLFVVGMTSTGFIIADPDDGGMLAPIQHECPLAQW